MKALLWRLHGSVSFGCVVSAGCDHDTAVVAAYAQGLHSRAGAGDIGQGEQHPVRSSIPAPPPDSSHHDAWLFCPRDSVGVCFASAMQTVVLQCIRDIEHGEEDS
jgi:hypothetical protein